MHDFLARRLTTTSGRWLTPDPAGLGAVDASNPQTWNRYAYVSNSPLNMVDPFGEVEDCYTAGTCPAWWQNSVIMGGWGDPFQLLIQTGFLGSDGQWGTIINSINPGDTDLGLNLPPFIPALPRKAFCSFTADVGDASQAAQNAIQPIFNQAGVGIDLGTGADADLDIANEALPHGILGVERGLGSAAFIDPYQAVSNGYSGRGFGVLIAHEWGHYVTGCVHNAGLSNNCGNWGLMAPGNVFGHIGLRGESLPGDPQYSQWQFQPTQFQSIQDKCKSLHGSPGS